MTKFKFKLGLIFMRLSLNNMLMHITANCNDSHIKILETLFWPYAIVAGWSMFLIV